ncbi:FixH family protein [Kibdelosporangium philippinense]|uniref:FixH family protein n=1 Tax=Kibdelosporangium philippinense TaxID=211113 RepID=A0ABS8ZAE4_9PSEU|nr:FixH family protein [Kibdelosporangium philippinense]MCE7003775.1 FixH family protein [Kibdelosporangium philippinense]
MKLVAALSVIAVMGVLLITLPGAKPVRLVRADLTVQLDKASTGTVVAQVETPPEVAAVSMFATMPQMGHLTGEITAIREKPGLFRATGELFSMAGRWELGVRADGRVVTFEIPVK